MPKQTVAGVPDTIRGLVADKLDPKKGGALPDNWNVHGRKDANPLQGDQYPRCVCVNLPERILEVETDNRAMVGYPVAVILLVAEATVSRTDPPLAALRRTCQQALHTTAYPGLVVEAIDVEEAAGVPLPDLEDGVTATAFTVVVGVCEDLATSPAGG